MIKHLSSSKGLSKEPVVTEPANTLHLQIDATFVALRTVSMAIDQLLRSEPMADDGTIYNIQLAVQELCTNIVEHGYHGFRGDIELVLTLQFEPQMIQALIVDSGDPFDKTAVAAPNLEKTQEHGYGLFLIEQLVDDFKYTRLSASNQWQLKRILDKNDQSDICQS